MTKGCESAGPAWLSDGELAAWRPFSVVLMARISAFDTQLRGDAKLSLFGFGVLAGLSEAPDRTLPMSDVAVLANGSLSRVSHAVEAVEGRGWGIRHRAPANGRITLVTLTDHGYAKLAESTPAQRETVSRLVIDPLTQQQLNQHRARVDGHPHQSQPDQSAPAATGPDAPTTLPQTWLRARHGQRRAHQTTPTPKAP